MTGILHESIQSQAKGTDPTPDAIYKAITKVRLAYAEPDGIILHPNDWLDIRLLRTTQGQYISAPIVESDPDRLFGKLVVTSPAIAENTGLVGAFGRGAQVWDRDQARVEFALAGLGDVDGTDLWSSNAIRFRAESRLAFGTTYPDFFCKVTGI
jgi:HK97 family phage major capsid protein